MVREAGLEPAASRFGTLRSNPPELLALTSGDRRVSRTPGLRIRSAPLYPSELCDRIWST